MSEELEAARLRRWRLLIGGSDQSSTADGVELSADDRRMDAALAAVYNSEGPGTGTGSGGGGGGRSAGLGRSAPRVVAWLGDIRSYFPSTVVQVVQRDAVERLNLQQLLLEPELLDAVEPDVELVATLISMSGLLPERSRATARAVVASVVREIERRIADRTRTAVQGALNRSARVRRPRRQADIDWNRTISANLQHWLPEHHTVVPERLVGYGRRQNSVQRSVVVAIDQSGSMAESVVYASIFGAVMAALPALRTSLVVFDTVVVDLTDQLHDPVEVLFGTQLGGGTDINAAVAYCQDLIDDPTDTIFVLVSDLYEGGIKGELVRRMNAMSQAGVQVIALLALSDSGAPSYDRDHAAALEAIGVPAFACTPDAFPDLLACAVQRGDLAAWAHRFRAEAE
ncbi:VWA domain-containing protein [Nakamurella flavida]|uniref:VWA domain-containing protein n=1 Tax=Nakamurella flavida TaxID=363630 RepID=A0A938YNH7_9ACTN|nr:VWA domain-containing protein [Nakamurella flavida]MBM9476464.1 VWA domain-containing protein [Nakamurella flavida]MDP9779435.1 Mg-chelatase subunit ChlD [Nakamurella flavida]